MIRESRAQAACGAGAGGRGGVNHQTRASESSGPTAAPGDRPDRLDPPTHESESIRPTLAPWGEWVRLGPAHVSSCGDEAAAAWTAGEEAGGDDRFSVLRPHAKGGIGQVSVALDVALNREVALKELLEELRNEPGSRARFQFEAEVTARLEHPGVVPVYAIGENARGEPFYVMRFIKGDSFKDAIRRFHASRGRLGLRRARRGWASSNCSADSSMSATRSSTRTAGV